MDTADALSRSEIEKLVEAGDIPEQDEAVVAGMLDSPALHAAPLAFWRACAPALTRLGTSDLAVRAWLLARLPESQEAGADELWFDLLENTGAVRGLIDVDDDPGVARPPDGAAGWLARVVRWQDWGLGELGRSARLLDLVERMAPRLRAEATVLELIGEHVQHADPDLLDLCLTLDLEFAVPNSDRLTIRNWLDEDPARRRDLTALARFDWSREVLARDVEHEVPKLVNGLSHDPVNAAVSRAKLQALLEHAGTREIIEVWLRRVAEPAESGALPVLEKAITALAPVVPEVVLAVAPELADRLAGAGIGRALARTLRIGLFDELGWAALDQAVAEYPPPHPPSWSHNPHSHTLQFQVTESWPALILNDSTRITVAGPDRVLLRHDVRTPPDRPVSDKRVRAEYVDGRLLVTWRHETGRLGYWSDHPEDVFRVKKNWLEHYDDRPASGLPLPGGRSGGGRPLRPGDRMLTPFEPVASDGERWWRQINSWSQFDHYWEEYDPLTGAAGARSRPAFFEPTPAEQSGANLLNTPCWLAPMQPGLEDTPLGTADGLLGWRAYQIGGGHLGVSITGATVRLSGELVARNGYARPVGLLRWPGREEPMVVLEGGNGISLMADDIVGSFLPTAGTGDSGPIRKPTVEQPYARGTALLPPASHWHALRPRDEAGSAALRAVTDAQVQDLLLAAQRVPDGEDLGPAIRQAVPEITDPKLIAGVTGVVRIAVGLVRQVQTLPKVDS